VPDDEVLRQSVYFDALLTELHEISTLVVPVAEADGIPGVDGI
jgi:hypothetical protein